MNPTKCSSIAPNTLNLVGGRGYQLDRVKPGGMMNKLALAYLALAMAGVANAADVNIPSGLTGLWRFQDTSNPGAGSLGAATVGSDIMFSNAVYGTWFLGSSMIDIGGEGWLTRYSDNYVFQESSWNYMAVNPNFTANGGGSYVNKYTVAIDYVQTQTGWNSLFQTSWGGNDSDGDLWIEGITAAASTIYTTELGYSALTFDSSKWHRIVWSVDNGNFFRVYVDGTNYLDGAGQGIDGRYALYPDRFNLFADNSWEDKWGLVGTVMTWNRALAPAEVAGLGGWLDGAATPTPLVYSNAPEVVSVSPADGETNAAPAFAYQAMIFDPVKIVDRNSFQLLLDGVQVTPVVSGPEASMFVKWSSGGLLPSGSTHKYTLTANVNGTPFTNEVTFKVQNYTSYEWRFTNADLSAALGNGVMTYADPSTTPGLTSFGTTDGSTVPHINGSPAKYMHVPAFTLYTDGYRLQFNDSGPNVGPTNINCYTLIFDMLVPSSPVWSDWVVPYFNTEPYNYDTWPSTDPHNGDNDADFWLTGTGEIGIGGGGYSGANTITADTWYRIALVTDLRANTLTYYVNGTNVWSRTADGLGGRWSIYSNQDPGPDLLLFNEPSSTGLYTHELYVSSVAFTDRALGADELAALGGPNANGCLVRSFTPKPTLAIQASTGGATVSWLSSYVGYALQQADTLSVPQWKPVAGITNNSVNVAVGSTPTFFRLTQ
jgi:hypothetical protein